MSRITFAAHDRCAFTVDNVIFGFDEADLKVLLIVRSEDPFLNEWALPGNFITLEEDIDSAAKRVLFQTTGIQDVYLEQVKTFGQIGRHAYGRVITIAYHSLVKIANYHPTPSGLAQGVDWHSMNELPELLAFDHREIIEAALEHLKRNVRNRPVGFELLPPEFTLTDLQHLYEAIWGIELEKRNFRKKILSMDLIVDLDKMQEGVAHRPARLYRFDERRYEELTKKGLNFEIKEGRRKEVT